MFGIEEFELRVMVGEYRVGIVCEEFWCLECKICEGRRRRVGFIC